MYFINCTDGGMKERPKRPTAVESICHPGCVGRWSRVVKSLIFFVPPLALQWPEGHATSYCFPGLWAKQIARGGDILKGHDVARIPGDNDIVAVQRRGMRGSGKESM